MEDNQGPIKCIKSSRFSENVRHLDVFITWLAEQYDSGVANIGFTKTILMLADCGTKLVNGELLCKQVSYLIGVHFYPHSSTEHYQLLALFDCSYFKNVSKTMKSYCSFASLDLQM